MKIVICGSFGAKNLGDEMILEGLLTSLRSVQPQSEITVLSGNPKETLERYGEKFGIKVGKKFAAGIKSFALSAIERFKPSGVATSKIIKECDWFILGGGGLFGSLTFRANLIWAVQALMAYRLKKPVVMYGQSISPIKWKIIRWLVKKIFQKAELIAVRDEDSKEQLKKLGVTKKIYLVPDLALRTTSPSPISHITPTIIVALRQMPGLSQHFKHYIAEFLDWLTTKHNYQIKFVNFQEGKEGDGKLHQEIEAMMKTKTESPRELSEAPEFTTPAATTPMINDLLHKFSHADLVLGMRLHSIISAIKTKTPFIAISYSPKVRNFLETAGHAYRQAGLQKYMINHESLDFEKLKSLFEKVVKDRMDIKKELEEFNARALKDCLKFEEEVLRKILKFAKI